VLAWLVAILTLPVSVVAFTSQLGLVIPGSGLVRPLWTLVDPLRSVNRYGLFAVMTTTRPEIIVEGSNDGVTWLEYEFKHKPGNVRRSPGWVAPHQPRLDWQMWFAALGPPEASPWIEPLLARLLLGSTSVRRLFAEPPPVDATALRIVSYRYRFTTPEERAATGDWWFRSDAMEWLPPLRVVRSAP
jgi:hypothetical protein